MLLYSGLSCLVAGAGTRRGPSSPPAWPNYWQRVRAITAVAVRASLSVYRPLTQARCQVAARARKDVRWGNSALTFGGQATADFHFGPGPRFTGAAREQGEKDALFVLLVVAPEWPRLQNGKLPQFDCKDDKGCTETKFQSSTAPNDGCNAQPPLRSMRTLEGWSSGFRVVFPYPSQKLMRAHACSLRYLPGGQYARGVSGSRRGAASILSFRFVFLLLPL